MDVLAEARSLDLLGPMDLDDQVEHALGFAAAFEQAITLVRGDRARDRRRRRLGVGHGGHGGRIGGTGSGQPYRGACRHGRDDGSEGSLHFPPG